MKYQIIHRYFPSIVMMVILLTSSSALSESETADRVVTLKQVCELAAKNAETIRIAENDLTIAMEDKKRALSVLYPTATTYGYYQKYGKPNTNNADYQSLGITLNQSFTLNGKELIAYRITKDAIVQQEFSLQAVKDEYIYQVGTAYLNILSLERLYEIAVADVERLEKHAQAVREKVVVGTLTRTALYRAEAELSGARAQVLKAGNAVRIAKATLKNLVGIEEPFSVTDDLPLDYTDFDYSLARLLDDALQTRPEIKALRTAVEIAEKTVKYEEGAWWPTLSLQAEYTDSRAEYDSPYHGVDRSDDVSFSATLSFTLFDGGLRKADIRQAKTDKSTALLSLQSQTKGVVLEAEEVWATYETAVSTLTAVKDELKSAQENFSAVSTQFEYGMADSVDMMDANTTLVTAQRSLSDAEYSIVMSILGILKTRGDIIAVLMEQP